MLILITGASKGIGFELVKHFAKNGKHLVLAVSRNTQSLHELINKNGLHTVLAIKADITKAAGLKAFPKPSVNSICHLTF